MMTEGDSIEEIITPIILKLIEPKQIITESLEFKEGHLYIGGESVGIDRYRRVTIYGYGKASYHMYNAVKELLSGWIDEAYIIVDKRMDISRETSENILRGRHPLPDEETVESSKKLLESAKAIEDGDLAINLISGGGSSLFEVPYHGLTLDDILPIWEGLMKRGCNINRLNTVRRHLSLVKGGRFAGSIYPGNTISLIISDVVGDPIHDIASGPTAPDPTTYREAYKVIREFEIGEYSKAVKFILEGVKGRHPDTLKPGDKIFNKVKNFIVGSLNILALKLKNHLEKLGFKANIVKVDLQGYIDDITEYITGYIKGFGRSGEVYIFGGEAYTRVLGDGVGGPNHELTLKLYHRIRRIGLKAQILCMDTDGVDGNSPGAGGYIDTYSIDIDEETLDNHLRRSDSYTLLKSMGLSLETGPTGSNLNSIWIVYLLS